MGEEAGTKTDGQAIDSTVDPPVRASRATRGQWQQLQRQDRKCSSVDELPSIHADAFFDVRP
jgi:hypothetical protein